MLVNKVLDYDYDHFITYSKMIAEEMAKRGYRTMRSVIDKIISLKSDYKIISFEELFADWHNERYLTQCYYNLQEKYDCGSITDENWQKIYICYNKEIKI